ncbi:alpha-ribazole phosphatase, partial [Vibrio parahaemolyticus AQ3810]
LAQSSMVFDIGDRKCLNNSYNNYY